MEINKNQRKKIFPKSTERVEKHTNHKVNDKIYRETILNIGKYMSKDEKEITQRLEELENEWDIERTLEANASTVILTGIALGAVANKKWLLLSGTAAGFLLQHSLQGWCPPLPIFRRLGFRTPSEIHEEMAALKYIRGDFDYLKS